ncbi:receptor-like protein 18 [Bidens hawaiensis]|uniref:receptor-like protein 18 n=1 Tax=Bidens hawaiensis TaxID=980011 RepID=UPI00404A8429
MEVQAFYDGGGNHGQDICGSCISVGQLSKLALLAVSNNSLEGVVSEVHFANLSLLEYLDTTSNRKLIFNISCEYKPPFQLRNVLLGSCKIAYGFPQWLQTQRKLEELVLSNASLYGLLPTWFRKMSIVSYLDLSHNKISGSLKNLPLNGFTGSLLLQENLFNGSIPASLCKSTGLTLLDVSGNSSNGLSGVLPSSLGNISSSLSWLKLNDNNFNGELPGELRNLRFLRLLDLGNNDFSETYQNGLEKILHVGHNNLTGPIPNCFGDLNGMIEKTQLDIRNGSSGSDENVIQVMKGMNLEYAKTLDLVFNMDLSSIKLTGQIPLKITTLTLLVGLNLSHNHLSGNIPDSISIGNMKALNSLDFSDNQFTGMIPPSMADLNFLSFMNLSHNNLSGRIPIGNQLQTLTDSSIYAGNRDLCGAPLPKQPGFGVLLESCCSRNNGDISFLCLQR